ncbi:MAG: PilW family protein [Aquabacterium sp.]
MPTPRRSRRRARGMSLVELMVSIVIALLIGLAAAGSAQMFSASQRTGIGAGGSSAAVNTVLTSIKNDLSQGGLGFFGDAQYMCTTMNLSVGANMVSDGAAFSPMRIVRSGNLDVVDVVYGNAVESGANILLNSTSDTTEAALMSLLPASLGQAVLIAPAQTAGPGPCTIRSITATTVPTETTPQQLTFADNGDNSTHNQLGFTAVPAYPSRGRVTLLGALQWNRYRVSGTDLVVDQQLTGNTGTLLRNVLAFRVQYGVSANQLNSTTLDSWVDGDDPNFANLTSVNMPRVRALRIGIVTRSTQRDKPDANGDCSATTDKPTLFGNVVEPDVTDWQCWRFRSAVVIVPLRNMVMGTRS